MLKNVDNADPPDGTLLWPAPAYIGSGVTVPVMTPASNMLVCAPNAGTGFQAGQGMLGCPDLPPRHLELSRFEQNIMPQLCAMKQGHEAKLLRSKKMATGR